VEGKKNVFLRQFSESANIPLRYSLVYFRNMKKKVITNHGIKFSIIIQIATEILYLSNN
jgi:hypothetical protein